MAPRVSIVIPAYNLARFLPAAIDSALAQDWPTEALEVIVVDDGSTDDTAAVLAGYGDRILAIAQDNGGLVRAVDRGLRAATGDYLALLDADDEWPVDRVRRQVEFLEAHPAVGLVHGDMEIIDAEGATIHPSFFAQQNHQLTRGRVLGRLLGGNFISGGASMVRGSLRAAFLPIPDDAAYPDWWLAATIAAVAEIDHLPGVFNRYRFHGANMGLGSGPERLGEILRKEIPWRRWMLRHLLGDETVDGADLLAAFRSWEHGLLQATAHAGGGARALAPVDDAQRAAARELAEAGAAALRADDADGAARLLLRALAEDPWDGAARFDLELALRVVAEGTAGEVPAADPLAVLPARRDVTLAWATELIRDPELLGGYAARVDGDADATLIVLTRGDEELGALVDLVESLGLAGDGAADLLAQPEPATWPARRLLEARAGGVLGLAPEGWAPAAAVAGAAM